MQNRNKPSLNDYRCRDVARVLRLQCHKNMLDFEARRAMVTPSAFKGLPILITKPVTLTNKPVAFLLHIL